MQRPETGCGEEEDGEAEEVVEEVEASVMVEAKAVPWAVREVVREAAQWAVREVVREAAQWAVREVVRRAAPKVRRLEGREAFQPASPWERQPPVLEGG